MSEWQFSCLSTRQLLVFIINKNILVLCRWFWPFLFSAMISHFKPPIYLHEIWNGLECQRGSQCSLPLVPQWGESPCRVTGAQWSLGLGWHYLSLVGQGCLEQPASTGSAVGQPQKTEQKRHWCHHSQSKPLGKDQRPCLSASLFPDSTQLHLCLQKLG